MVYLDKIEKVASYGLMYVNSYVFRPKTQEDVQEIFVYAQQHNFKICPLGSRLSFSNVALLDKQIALDLTLLNKIVEINLNQHYIIVQAGVKITSILKLILPQNYTLVGLTGSYGNTVAGNISNDVNGKDTWKNGTFSNNVEEMTVILASGETMQVNRVENADIFHAITGGLGLIAVILEVRLKLTPIVGSTIQTQTIKCTNLEGQLSQFEKLKPSEDDFAYAWTDGFAPKKHLGRGLFEKAKFIKNKSTNDINWDKYLTQKEKIFRLKTATFWKFIRTIYKPRVHQLAGYAKYHNPIFNKLLEVPFPEYQYPMTKYFPQWNLLFYPDGFREIQILASVHNFEKLYSESLFFCRKEGIYPYICALRKHISQEGLLSFAGNGYSFTINFGLNGMSPSKLNHIESGLVDICTKYNGIIYIGKFPFFAKQHYQEMYPEFLKFKAIKQKIDKSNLLWSDAASIFLT